MPTTQAKQALRKFRRDNGLCIQCGAVAIFDEVTQTRQTLCQKHADKANSSRKTTNQQKRIDGICRYDGCHNPIESNKAYCYKHRKIINQGRKQLEQDRAAVGLCPKCGKPKGVGRYCDEHARKRSDDMKTWRSKLLAAGLCWKCPVGNKEPVLEGFTLCERHLDLARQRHRELKFRVLNAYGGPVCVGCGETEPVVLQIDHINGGGHKHAVEIGNGDWVRGRSKLYRWLRDNDFPPGFRVLCANCNLRAAHGIPFPPQC